MNNSKTGFVCIDPLSFFFFMGLLVENDYFPEELLDNDAFALVRTKGHELNEIYTSKIQLIMEVGIEAYKLMIDIVNSGIQNETYDFAKITPKGSRGLLDDLMRYMYAVKFIYQINPSNPIGFDPNKPNQIDKDYIGSVEYQTKKANLINRDETIKFDHRQYVELLQELNTEYLVNTNSQTFVKVSRRIQDEILAISAQRDGINMPITYITQFIIMNTIKYYDLNGMFPNVPYDLANVMLSKLNKDLREL
jgi:hypothetical protein